MTRHRASSTMPAAAQADGIAVPALVSLKTISRHVDAHRASVRRWLAVAGVHPVALGRGRNSAIRYRRDQVERWLATLGQAD